MNNYIETAKMHSSFWFILDMKKEKKKELGIMENDVESNRSSSVSS